MINDLKFAARVLAKSPGFTTVAVLTLALGIGANAAIFSVVEGALLRPLPFREPKQLVRIFETPDARGVRASSLNLTDRTVVRLREFAGDVFDDVAAGTGGAVAVNTTGASPAETVPSALVSANFFSVLGLLPAQGRAFVPEEAREGANPVAVVSDDFWRNDLGGRADVIGSKVIVDGNARTIVGVMPKMFRHPYRASIWLPLVLRPDDTATLNNHYLYGVGRLRRGISAAKGEEAVQRIFAAINRDDPNPANARAAYMPQLRESFVMDLRPQVIVILAAAVCALLIAAA